MTRPKTPDQLRADAAHLRKLAADMIVKADKMEREARAMADEPRDLAAWWFAYVERVRRAS